MYLLSKDLSTYYTQLVWIFFKLKNVPIFETMAFTAISHDFSGSTWLHNSHISKIHGQTFYWPTIINEFYYTFQKTHKDHAI